MLFSRVDRPFSLHLRATLAVIFACVLPFGVTKHFGRLTPPPPPPRSPPPLFCASFCKPYISSFTLFSLFFFSQGRWEDALSILGAMMSGGLRPNVQTVCSTLRACCLGHSPQRYGVPNSTGKRYTVRSVSITGGRRIR